MDKDFIFIAPLDFNPSFTERVNKVGESKNATEVDSSLYTKAKVETENSSYEFEAPKTLMGQIRVNEMPTFIDPMGSKVESLKAEKAMLLKKVEELEKKAAALQKLNEQLANSRKALNENLRLTRAASLEWEKEAKTQLKNNEALQAQLKSGESKGSEPTNYINIYIF